MIDSIGVDDRSASGFLIVPLRMPDDEHGPPASSQDCCRSFMNYQPRRWHTLLTEVPETRPMSSLTGNINIGIVHDDTVFLLLISREQIAFVCNTMEVRVLLFQLNRKKRSGGGPHGSSSQRRPSPDSRRRRSTTPGGIRSFFTGLHEVAVEAASLRFEYDRIAANERGDQFP